MTLSMARKAELLANAAASEKELTKQGFRHISSVVAGYWSGSTWQHDDGRVARINFRDDNKITFEALKKTELGLTIMSEFEVTVSHVIELTRTMKINTKNQETARKKAEKLFRQINGLVEYLPLSAQAEWKTDEDGFYRHEVEITNGPFKGLKMVQKVRSLRS